VLKKVESASDFEHEYRIASADSAYIKQKKTPASKGKENVKEIDDKRKRPLLTAEQLQGLRRIPETIKKGTPREQFENLFRNPIEVGTGY